MKSVCPPLNYKNAMCGMLGWVSFSLVVVSGNLHLKAAHYASATLPIYLVCPFRPFHCALLRTEPVVSGVWYTVRHAAILAIG